MKNPVRKKSLMSAKLLDKGRLQRLNDNLKGMSFSFKLNEKIKLTDMLNYISDVDNCHGDIIVKVFIKEPDPIRTDMFADTFATKKYMMKCEDDHVYLLYHYDSSGIKIDPFSRILQLAGKEGDLVEEAYGAENQYTISECRLIVNLGKPVKVANMVDWTLLVDGIHDNFGKGVNK